MTNPLAISTLNVQIVASTHHGIIEEIGLFGEIADSRSGEGNMKMPGTFCHITKLEHINDYHSQVKTQEPA